MGIQLDMIGIVVKDMRRALDFYRVLGFEKIIADPDGNLISLFA